MFEIGDWVQATGEVTEEIDSGEEIVHAYAGGVGHVISITDNPEWIDVFFERHQTITVCHVSELRRLGDASTGRYTVSRV